MASASQRFGAGTSVAGLHVDALEEVLQLDVYGHGILGIVQCGGFQLVMRDPQARWMVDFVENPITRATPISGNFHLGLSSYKLVCKLHEYYSYEYHEPC